MKTTIIIITYALLLIGGLTSLAITHPTKEVTQNKSFVGVDANGNNHYEDGHVEWNSNLK